MKEVKSPKKPLIYYYGIVLLILFLFNLIVTPLLAQGQVVEVDYGTFMSMTEDGQVGRVEIQEQEISFSLQTRRKPPSTKPPWWTIRI